MTDQREPSKRLSKHEIALTVAVVGLTAIVFFPTLRWLVASWSSNPYYSHGFLVPLLSAYFAWRKRDALKHRKPSNIGLAVLALGLGVHLLAFPWQAHLVSASALVLVLTGLLLYFYGLETMRPMLFPLGFLLLMIPLPFVERLAPSLEAFVARYATLMMRALGTPVDNLGSQVRLANGAVIIGAPCSGLRSIVSLFTLAVLFVYVVSGPLVGKIVLVVAAPPIAMIANLVRVASLLQVAHLFGPEVGMGYYHTLASPLLFLVVFILFLVLGRILGCSELRQDI
ncbi:MAG: exosortase/archaeosortase family protein [Anaerolineae bacterium]